jgi:hypothetical protein
MDNNFKLNLENIKYEINKYNIKKDYEEYKKFIIIEKLNKSNLLEIDIEKKWLQNKMPLLKRQKAFSESN